MPVFRQSAGSDRQIVTRSQLVSVSWFQKSAGSTSLRTDGSSVMGEGKLAVLPEARVKHVGDVN